VRSSPRHGRMLRGGRGLVFRRPRASGLAADLPERGRGGFTQPVHVTHAGDGSGRTFVVEQAGRIRILDNGALLPTPYLDLASVNPPRLIAGGEQGLLSVAFPPGSLRKDIST